MLSYRPFDLQSDAEIFARLYSTSVPDPISPQNVLDWWAPRKGKVRVHSLALDEEGRLVGSLQVDREDWMRPRHWFLKVIVTPERQRQGLGASLYGKALAVAHQRHALALESSLRDDDPASLRFAQKRGFEIEHHSFGSTLELTSFDETRCAPLLERQRGLRFFSLAEAGVTEANKRKLYELNRASGMDNPGNGGVFPDYDNFSQDVFNSSWFRAETQLLAADGDQWVGLSAVALYPEKLEAYNAFTGVLAAYRGRGLAQALKLQTIMMAKVAGMRVIRTDNDSQNAPMLAINRKLGYQPETGRYALLCKL